MAVSMYASTAFYEGGLAWFKAGADTILVSNTKPTSTWLWADFRDASSSTGLWMAGSTIMASSDWIIAAGTISGYKVSMTATSNTNTMDVTGPNTKAGSICVGSGASSALMYITTCSTVALSTSDQVTIPAWRIETLSPTSS